VNAEIISLANVKISTLYLAENTMKKVLQGVNSDKKR
jgi:hypothetical protein